ncbi:MAG: tRNA lysidine(34) synthetase TilS [Clostridia bacterium]|nr:tRNA lysidine(34) synthetase TilS [Clostridia bacterium]
MTDKVLKTISEHHMIPIGSILGIGLSGGADSVCLAHILLNNKEKLGISKLKAIHIHHGIRGEEADRDLEFCRKFCEKNGMDFVFYKADIPAEAQKTGESIEECARRIRYSFFEDSGCDVIATAHNLNDNIETFIFNLSRGSSLSGLCGIPFVREIYIRPLLDCSRTEIEEYIKENELNYITDSTNLCDDYTRNKIRHNIVPLLFDLNPSFEKAFAKCNESLNDSKDYIYSRAVDLLEKSRNDGYYDCSVFLDEHKALKSQVISLILKENNAKNISREHINSVSNLLEKGGSIDICGNVTVNIERKKMFFGKLTKTEDFDFAFDLNSRNIVTPYGEYDIKLYSKKDLQIINKQDIDNFIDCDKISTNAVLRNRRDGDSYQLPKRPNKTLKKLFNEKKIENRSRGEMLILSDDNGIVWTEFFGVSSRCKSNKDTKKYIKISKVGKNNV